MKKYFIQTFGCKVNQYDSQVFREELSAAGYVPAAGIEEADIVLVNSCTVTSEADRQCRQLLRQTVKRNPAARVMVAGCYARRNARELREISDRIEPVEGKRLFGDGGRPAAISSFDGHARAFVKIQDGCDDFCSYCIVPHVRNELWSRPPGEILGEIERLAGNGYREVVLSGIHVGKYAGGVAALLERIVRLPGDFRVRLSSIEVNEVGPELVSVMRGNPGRVCAHLHLPLQSGSDAVLRRMNRRYTAGEFVARAKEVLAALPAAGLTTDVIVGFPGETEDDFARTRRVVEEVGFSRVHVFRYSPREGTPAASFDGQVPSVTSQERLATLAAVAARLQAEFVRRFAGTVRPVVREGGRKALLTDNYLHLRCDEKDFPARSGIVPARIELREGEAWGVRV